MNIDKVFVINLEHRTDRKAKILMELQRMNISNYEFVQAYKPDQNTLQSWNKEYLNPMPPWFKSKSNENIMNYKLGSLGCMMSHLHVLKTCLERNYENVLILEDDTEFLMNNEYSLDEFFKNHENSFENLDFGIVYLCGNHLNVPSKFNDILMKVNNTLTTGSYVINKKVMLAILNNIRGYDREIDVYYASIIQKKFPCYCIYPHLTGQTSGYSDILQKNINYKF